jgi:hypothetical protein
MGTPVKQTDMTTFGFKFSGTFVALGFALVLASCTNGLKQDPYADQPESVKNAGPMDPKPKQKPADADNPAYLRINAEDSYQFTEGEKPPTVTITGKILSDVNGHSPQLGSDYELSIDNMADFPGASFDASTGNFVWSPQPGYVEATYSRNIHIDVTLTTKFLPIRKTTRSIIGVVTRAELDPTIVSVEDLVSLPTKEGEKREFKVVVRDPHADSKTANTKPRLTISSDDSSAGVSAANLIYCKGFKGCTDPAIDPKDPMQYIFTLVLDLTNKEVTSGETTMSFGLIATSRFGEPSAVKKTNVHIITSINNPEMSWAASDPITVVAGQENTVNFTVYDPKGTESNLTVNFDTRCDQVLATDAVCSCKSGGPGSGATQLCTISWKVPAQPTQSDFQISLSSFNQSKYDGSILKKTFPPRTLHVIQPAPGGNPPGPIHSNSVPVATANGVSTPGVH